VLGLRAAETFFLLPEKKEKLINWATRPAAVDDGRRSIMRGGSCEGRGTGGSRVGGGDGWGVRTEGNLLHRVQSYDTFCAAKE
jgi:hypothetical protein